MVKVDTSEARSNLEVVRMCLEELGWNECTLGSCLNSDIYWNAATYQAGHRDFKLTSARVNKFPGMCDLMRKINLIRSLNIMGSLFPDEFDFYPKTWFLPEQNQQFQDDIRSIHEKDRKHQRSLTTFIVKPSDGSQGEGIYLIRDVTRCFTNNKLCIVQEYIDRPLLIDDLKFDIRIYVLILSLDPLRILLYDEGLARFATVDYEAPSTLNLHETFMHLTNSSLNKQNTNYKHSSDEEQNHGSKRKLTFIWSQLCKQFGSVRVERAKGIIIEMINKTILAILPELRVQYALELPISRKQNRCFQIIGFDIILTDQLKPILLEVNANPSLRVDSDRGNKYGKPISWPSLIHVEIKKPLVLETLKLVLTNKQTCKQLETNEEIIVDQTSTELSTIQIINSNRWFKLIYPSTDQFKYEQMRFLEKIAFIYIDFVIRRGHKTMNSRLFRNFASTCGILDRLIILPSIDMIYAQIIYKWKQYFIPSTKPGLHFPLFVEAFLQLARRKYSILTSLFESVTHLIESCSYLLNLSIEEPN